MFLPSSCVQRLANADALDESVTPMHSYSIGSRLSELRMLTDELLRLVRSGTLPLLTGILAIGIFIIDTITPYEISAATFYVIVVLLSARFGRTQGMVTVSGICIALTIASYILTPHGNFGTGIINTSISLLAIAATTYLAVQIESARVAAEQAQARLAHVARITTLGEIAASIAHEVNQPLAAIVTNANACTRWMQARPANFANVASSIDSIVSDANRASEIIKRVRALSIRAEPKKSWIEINGVVRDVLALVQNRFRDNRTFVYANLESDLPMILGDRIQLQQVLLNILMNAIDAMNTLPSNSREICISSAKSSACGVIVTIEDTGSGIDPGIVPHLFDAFHSTKSDGMGIGLSICRSIIESHGGNIWAEPTTQRGATFCFTLPGDREKIL